MEVRRKVKDYNTVTRGCAERCAKIRQGIEAGIGPGNIISEACKAAGITYGGCHSESGPELLGNGQERCHLPLESAQAVDAYAAGVRTTLARQGAAMAIQELRTTALGEV